MKKARASKSGVDIRQFAAIGQLKAKKPALAAAWLRSEKPLTKAFRAALANFLEPKRGRPPIAFDEAIRRSMVRQLPRGDRAKMVKRATAGNEDKKKAAEDQVYRAMRAPKK